MKIQLWAIGKTKAAYLTAAEQEFTKRLSHYFKFEISYYKNVKHSDPQQIKKSEAQLILDKLKTSDHLILLDEKGKSYGSRDFAKRIESYSNRSLQNVVFLIGGAYGFHELLYARANEKLSISQMTFSHQLIRTIFLEQLYRAGTIIKGESYHND